MVCWELEVRPYTRRRNPCLRGEITPQQDLVMGLWTDLTSTVGKKSNQKYEHDSTAMLHKERENGKCHVCLERLPFCKSVENIESCMNNYFSSVKQVMVKKPGLI